MSNLQFSSKISIFIQNFNFCPKSSKVFIKLQQSTSYSWEAQTCSNSGLEKYVKKMIKKISMKFSHAIFRRNFLTEIFDVIFRRKFFDEIFRRNFSTKFSPKIFVFNFFSNFRRKITSYFYDVLLWGKFAKFSVENITSYFYDVLLWGKFSPKNFFSPKIDFLHWNCEVFPQLWFLTKIPILAKKIIFWPKMSILDKNFHFFQFSNIFFQKIYFLITEMNFTPSITPENSKKIMKIVHRKKVTFGRKCIGRVYIASRAKIVIFTE